MTRLAVGGLLAFGFDADESHLLIVSHNGRVVYRTADWVRVARKSETGEPWEESGSGDDGQAGAAGIGPLVGVRVPVTLFGTGELRVASPSGRFALRCTAQAIEIE